MLLNLTSRRITISVPEGEINLPAAPPGRAAEVKLLREFDRYEELPIEKGKVIRIPVYRTTIGPIHNLPAPRPEVIYIVPLQVAEVAIEEGRTDVLAVTDMIREDGRPVAARGLAFPEKTKKEGS